MKPPLFLNDNRVSIYIHFLVLIVCGRAIEELWIKERILIINHFLSKQVCGEFLTNEIYVISKCEN